MGVDWIVTPLYLLFQMNSCWLKLLCHCCESKVLGTFITEWDEGKIIASKLLETKESAHMYAERLTELAVALGFDGWLVYST